MRWHRGSDTETQENKQIQAQLVKKEKEKNKCAQAHIRASGMQQTKIYEYLLTVNTYKGVG